MKQNFNVFAIVSSRFKLVLSTEETVKESGWPGGGELDQQSVFAASTRVANKISFDFAFERLKLSGCVAFFHYSLFLKIPRIGLHL